MLAGATRGVGGPALVSHLLSRKDGQKVVVYGIRSLDSPNLKDALREMVAGAAHARTDRPIHHVHTDPPPGFETPALFKRWQELYEKEFGLEDQPRIIVAHKKKGRIHEHRLYSLARIDGSVVDLSWERARREKVSRIVEHEFGLPFVAGKHNRAVYNALVREGRHDVAAAIKAARLLSVARPTAVTPQERQQTERTAVPLVEVRTRALAAWRASDDGAAFVAALAPLGLRLAKGHRGLVLIDRSGAVHSLTRSLSAAARKLGDRVPAAAVRARLAELPIPVLRDVRADRRRAEAQSPRGTDGTRDLTAATASPLRPDGTGGRDRATGQDAAGSQSGDNEPGSRGEGTTMAQGLKPARKIDYKVRLLSEAAPDGFDAAAWHDDIHMVKPSSPNQPTTRILLRDGGWVEVDKTRSLIQSWGKRGRGDALAAALADAGSWQTRRLRRTATFARKADAPQPGRLSEAQAEALALWWQDHGYSVTAAPDGCWVQAGLSRIRDTGDHLEIHGPVSDEAIQAILTKAHEVWGGGAELTGEWSQKDQDRLWIEAQRQGVTLHGCRPSDAALQVWEKESAAAQTQAETFGLVKASTREAQDLLAGARGDPAPLGRLAPELQAFVRSYLDDDQRAELAQADVADIVPELRRFKSLGHEELKAIKQRNADREGKPAKVKFDRPRDPAADAADHTIAPLRVP